MDKSIEEIKKLYLDDGLPYREVCRTLGITKAYFKSLCKQGIISKKRDQKKDISKEELEELYINQNLSSTDIAEIVGCGKSWIGKLIKKYGLVKDKETRMKRTLAKMAKTNLEKYGSISPFGNSGVREKAVSTLEDRYSCSVPGLNSEIREKIEKTCIEKYGSISPLSNTQIRAKAQKTNLEKYGSITCFGNKEIQDKVKATLQERYGTHTPKQLHLSDRTRELFNNRESLKTYLESFSKPPTLYDLIKELGVTHSALNKKITEYDLRNLVNYHPGATQGEREICDILTSWGIVTRKDRTQLEGLEIDLYCPDYKIGIEFNGNHWHSIDSKGKGYHQKKSLLAEEKDLFIYHIFEYEWLEKREQLINQLRNLFGKNEQKLGARQCSIREVDSREAREFLVANHLQGADSSKVKLGLYYKEELVSLMTFCKPRFNKDFEYELSRFCCKANTNVVGGASKLFKHFIKIYRPSSIISYSDISHTRGDLYSKLGFRLDKISKPNYVWVKGIKYLTRYQCQKHKLIELFPSAEGTSESEIMTNLGYEKLEDSGNKVWIMQL